MIETEERKERAILAGVHTGSLDELADTTEESMAELERLAETAEAEVVAQLVQNRQGIETGTYLGEGKLIELAEAVQKLDADIVIFDSELSPIQIRNIETKLKVRVIDRSMLILDIFASRASSKEGKIQVELAQLKYMLPRLSGIGTQLSRQGGGIGTKGPGEKKLETDRRHIRRRISALAEELAEIRRHRELLRGKRIKDGIPVVALVGYTNAGKSSLLNKLTDSNIFACDKLFATLDPTSRSLELPDGRKIILVDTVGFIRKLPHHLIEAFKSTLEEAVYADVLLNVVDSSSFELERHIKVVENLLVDISADDKPTVLVYNKSDKKDPEKILPVNLKNIERTVCISAKTGDGINELLQILDEVVPGKKREATFLIPYSSGSYLSELHNEQTVLSEEYAESGTLVRALVDSKCYAKMRNFIYE